MIDKKKIFEASILRLEQQFDIDEKASVAFQTILPNDFVTSYDNSKSTEAIIDLLAYIVGGDKYYESNKELLEYYIYELKFGSEYYDGCIVDEKDNYIRLSNSDELWNDLNHVHK